MTIIKGSCLCGAVAFEIEKASVLVNCHCSVCRKTTGASFGTFALVKPDRFRLISGDDQIDAGFEWAPGHARKFCRRCGSPVPAFVPAAGMIGVPAGLLDDDPGTRPSLHLFASSKAPWVELADDLQRHEKWVPGFEPPDLPG